MEDKGNEVMSLLIELLEDQTGEKFEFNEILPPKEETA